MVNPQSIIDWYYEQDFDRSWFDFDDHLVSAIQYSSTVSQMDAEHYATSNSHKLWNQFRLRIESDRRRGFYPTFSEVAAGVKRLFWFPMFFPPELAKVDRHKRTRIRSRRHITEAIRSLSPVEYEALSLLACKLSGASHSSLTPATNEFGIDFFAIIPSLGRSRLLDGGMGPVRIVGQSKKHAKEVERGLIQRFVSILSSIRERSEDVRELMPNWFASERGPIVGWFVAHNGLQSGAMTYANRHGIIHSDSRDLAEIITMSRAWQPSDGINAPVDMMRREIAKILSQ